ncbi:hypothetical protein BTUL_0013g00500 [Botrytis tulipae]|uniref:C2H2-type domain-containing protein n=1 Tax=Botrytis tulipae TaxID=87230 RepID=A0A4Z1F9I7_9HELO|nr:hypothetical protein BTUL_0013g00500 [Botrytis tulipae]
MQFLNTTSSSLRIIFAIALFVLSAPAIAVPVPLSHTDLNQISLLGICFNGKESIAQDMAWAIPMQAENVETYFGTNIVEEGRFAGPSERSNSVTRASMVLIAAVANDPWPDLDRGPSLYINSGVIGQKEFVVGGTKVEDSHDQSISIYDDWHLDRVDFYHNPLDFTYFNWDDFEQFDNDPCSEFLEVFNDEPSSESHQDNYSIPPVIADASPFVFPFETLPNAPVYDHQDIGSGFSRPCDEPCYAQSQARTPALDNSAYNQTDVTSNSYPFLSANVSSGSSPQESPGKKTIKDAKHFCTICQKGCNTKAILRRHLKIHDPNLKCDFPGCSQKPFAENRDLERHRASHSIIGPLLYFCSAENCDMSQINDYKGSVRADNIKRHISRRHAGQDIQVLRKGV